MADLEFKSRIEFDAERSLQVEVVKDAEGEYVMEVKHSPTVLTINRKEKTRILAALTTASEAIDRFSSL